MTVVADGERRSVGTFYGWWVLTGGCVAAVLTGVRSGVLVPIIVTCAPLPCLVYCWPCPFIALGVGACLPPCLTLCAVCLVL